MRNVAQAKKAFYDWLDSERPWDRKISSSSMDMYVVMEQIVAAAERFFSICKPTSKEGTFSISLAQARKMFYDFMDNNRPWANIPFIYDQYAMMESMVRSAAWCFAHEMCPTKEDIARLENDLITVTTPMSDHPDGYDGTCNSRSADPAANQMTSKVRIYLGDRMEDVIRKYERALNELDLSCKVEKVEDKDQFTYFEIDIKTSDGD